MKPQLTLFFLFIIITSRAQSFTTVTMAGIGEIKVGMKKADLEKLIGTPIKLKNLLKKESDRDTVLCTYKDIPMQVVLDKNFTADNLSEIVVWEVKSSSPQLKTKSGIGMGEDKLKIITTYEGYIIFLMPEYENNYTVKSKTKSTVTLRGDESGNVIIFYLTNNKVTAISVTYEEGC
ncbi:MAG TPA: hypothetical protein VM888_07525 [Chitinophagaceae bacterium]|jgi:hypothetical protein|nr:hypothetical protein [Chitinophagaceae bacterium]